MIFISVLHRYFRLDFDDDYFLGFQEKRMQSGHDGQTIMIKVVQCQNGGPFFRLAWDPRITLFRNSNK